MCADLSRLVRPPTRPHAANPHAANPPACPVTTPHARSPPRTPALIPYSFHLYTQISGLNLGNYNFPGYSLPWVSICIVVVDKNSRQGKVKES